MKKRVTNKTEVVMKIWIGRDSAIIDNDLQNYLERHPEDEYRFAELHLFYDKPVYENGKWSYERDAAIIPSYMFPKILCGECWEFETSWDDIPEYMHFGGRLITKENYNKE